MRIRSCIHLRLILYCFLVLDHTSQTSRLGDKLRAGGEARFFQEVLNVILNRSGGDVQPLCNDGVAGSGGKLL